MNQSPQILASPAMKLTAALQHTDPPNERIAINQSEIVGTQSPISFAPTQICETLMAPNESHLVQPVRHILAYQSLC